MNDLNDVTILKPQFNIVALPGTGSLEVVVAAAAIRGQTTPVQAPVVRPEPVLH